MSLDLLFFRQRLLDELKQLKAFLKSSHSAGATVVLDQSSVGRLSRMDAMQQQAMAHGLSERMQSNKRGILAALQRLDVGTYGLCCQCEEEIESNRLTQHPAAVFCLGCMQERDTGRTEQ
jgi:DnaK suppressor protein